MNPIRLGYMYSDNVHRSPLNPQVTTGWCGYKDDGQREENAQFAAHLINEDIFEPYNFTWEDVSDDGTLKHLRSLRTGEDVEGAKLDEAVDIIFFRGFGSSQDLQEHRAEMEKKLKRIEQTRIPTVGNVGTILRAGFGKQYLLDLYEEGFPVPACTRASSCEDVEAFAREHGQVVVKSLDGYGGNDVHLYEGKNDQGLENLLTQKRDFFVQRFVPEIRRGERSLYIFDGQVKYTVMKVPKNGIFANAAKGSKVTLIEPTKQEISIATEVAQALKISPVLMRVDVIGARDKPQLLELTLKSVGMNIKNPTDGSYADGWVAHEESALSGTVVRRWLSDLLYKVWLDGA